MDTDNLINKILEIANYPEEKRALFINRFNHFFLIKLLVEIGKVDNPAGKKVVELFKNEDVGEEEITPVIQEILQNAEVKDVVDRVTREVLGELVDDVASSASEEQKQQILSSLPASA